MVSEDHDRTGDERPESTGEAKTSIDPMRLRMLMQQIRDEQNLGLGVGAGVLAAIVGATIWAVITAATHYQIGWMAIGVGFLVGFAVRQFGRGIDSFFGIVGAALALLGCLLGNLFSVCIQIGHEMELGYFEVLGALDLGAIVDIVVETFHPMDLLFYGIAMYAGFKYSFRSLTETEVKGLLKEA